MFRAHGRVVAISSTFPAEAVLALNHGSPGLSSTRASDTEIDGQLPTFFDFDDSPWLQRISDRRASGCEGIQLEVYLSHTWVSSKPAQYIASALTNGNPLNGGGVSASSAGTEAAQKWPSMLN